MFEESFLLWKLLTAFHASTFGFDEATVPFEEVLCQEFFLTIKTFDICYVSFQLFLVWTIVVCHVPEKLAKREFNWLD
jgi:hypothetical protein